MPRPRRARGSRAASRRARARRCRRAARRGRRAAASSTSRRRVRGPTPSKLYDIDIVVLDRTVVIHVRQRGSVCRTHWKASSNGSPRGTSPARRRRAPRRATPSSSGRRATPTLLAAARPRRSSTRRRRCAARALVAVVDGAIWAARGLDDDRAIADPFRPSAEAAGLLALRVDQLRAADARAVPRGAAPAPPPRRPRRRLSTRGSAVGRKHDERADVFRPAPPQLRRCMCFHNPEPNPAAPCAAGAGDPGHWGELPRHAA